MEEVKHTAKLNAYYYLGEMEHDSLEMDWVVFLAAAVGNYYFN